MVEHLGELVHHRKEPVKKAKILGLLFDRLPTYVDLKGGTGREGTFRGQCPVYAPGRKPISLGGPDVIRTPEVLSELFCLGWFFRWLAWGTGGVNLLAD